MGTGNGKSSQTSPSVHEPGRYNSSQGWVKTARKSDLMTSCAWLDIHELTAYHTAVQLFKTVRWGAPSMLLNRLERVEDDLLSTRKPQLIVDVLLL